MIPGLGRFPWSRKWQPAPVFLPGKFHGQRSLADYSPLGRKELDRIAHTPDIASRGWLPGFYITPSCSVSLWGTPCLARKKPPPRSGYRSALSRSCFLQCHFPSFPLCVRFQNCHFPRSLLCPLRLWLPFLLDLPAQTTFP